MALSLSRIVSSATVRRRLPLVGAFCMLSLGLSNLCPSLSLSSKTGCAQSLPFVPLLRSKFVSRKPAKSVHTIRMEASNKTVPSIVVYVTVPNKEAGKKLAESIVKEKLAACVNRVPGIESVYQWQGEIQTDSEELLIIKTRESLLEALTEHVKSNHEYEHTPCPPLHHRREKNLPHIWDQNTHTLLVTRVPEVISMPITGGNIQYLEWIKNSTRD